MFHKAVFLIVSFFVFIVPCYAKTVDNGIIKYLSELESLSDQQYRVMTNIYRIGVKYDLQYTLMTIAWKESNFGKWIVNLSDGKYGSFGVYHIRLDYSLKRNGITSEWGRDRRLEVLLTNLEESTLEAISVIQEFKKHIKKTTSNNVLRKTFSSYNGGYNYNHHKALKYGEDALLRFKALQIYFKRYNLEQTLKDTYLVSNQ